MTSPTPPRSRPRADPGAAYRLSQLDQIADMDGRGADIRPRRSIGFFVAGGAALLMIMAIVWALVRALSASSPAAAPPPAPALAREARTALQPPPARAGSPESAPASAPVGTPASAVASQPAAQPTAAASAIEAPVSGAEASLPSMPSASAAERARRAQRARQEAEFRAAQLKAEQDRVQAEELERQRRNAEQQQAAAEEARRRAAEPVPARAPPSPEPRRSVREICAPSSNVFSQAFCRSRECRKAEHAVDPLCVQLKDIEDAQRRAAEH